MTKVVIGADHAGVLFKDKIKNYLEKKGDTVDNCGSDDLEQSVDYPDFAHKVCKRVLENLGSVGVLICGSGIGMSIVANRYPGIRAALCWNTEVARLSREHDDANILVLGARFMSYECAESCLEVFLNTSFEGGRHQRRLDKIDNLRNQ